MIEELEELEEEQIILNLETYISSEEYTMAGEGEGEGEGEAHNFNGETLILGGGIPRIGGGIRGGGNRGGRDGGWVRWRGEENREDLVGFPILDEDTTVTVKNISPSILPIFHGLRNEDIETFVFEFEVLCRSYDYLQDYQKMKFFPTTLKDATLKCFMGLITHSIRTWEKMKSTFLQKYKDYCTPHTQKDEFFKMMQREDEKF